MLRIAICDDNEVQAGELKNGVEHILFAQTEYEIVLHYDSRGLIDCLAENSHRYDLLFLDIHMPEKDGISVAQYIRKEKLDLDIIFYSVDQDYILEGFTYKAFSYLLKPLDYRRLSSEIQRYLEEKHLISDCLNVNIRGSNVRIPLRKTTYFVSEGRQIKAVMLDGSIRFYEKMDAVWEMIKEEGFLRCHQSYCINLKYMQSHNKSGIILEGGEKIPISRSYQKEVEERLRRCT